MAGAFCLLTAVFVELFYGDKNLLKEVLAMFMPQMEAMVKDGAISFFAIFKNNLFACALCLGLGFIPILYIPAWALISNAMVMGAVLAFGDISASLPLGKAVVFGMLPHGIFELPAIFLSVAMGLTLCKHMSFAVFGMKKRAKPGQPVIEEEKTLPMLNRLAKNFVIVVIPLLIVAAFVETQITPEILSRMGMN